ncbi:MAG: hypothetical protein WA771_00815 [Chthoniobacterales bacterium]
MLDLYDMVTSTIPMTPKQVREEVETIQRASKKILASKETAREFLVKFGFITKSGKVTRRYGG